MEFAVINAGGKQYKVSSGDKLKIEKAISSNGEIVFDEVLLKADNGEIAIGQPYVKGASVTAKVLKDGREGKKIIFRYHSKVRYRKFKTHRQPFTEIEILKIA